MTDWWRNSNSRANNGDPNRDPWQTLLQDEIERKQENLISVLRRVDEDVKEHPRDKDAPEIPKEELDSDWFAQWREGASSVSNEEIQRWWAKLLRKKVSQPAKYSLRTLVQLS